MPQARLRRADAPPLNENLRNRVDSAPPMVAAPASPTVMLLFALPASLRLCAPLGRWIPCIHQARVDVGQSAVEVRAFNGSEVEARRIAFDQVHRFLIAIAGGRSKLPIASFAAQLRTARAPDRYEHYEIVTGAAISITRALMSPDLVA